MASILQRAWQRREGGVTKSRGMSPGTLTQPLAERLKGAGCHLQLPPAPSCLLGEPQETMASPNTDSTFTVCRRMKKRRECLQTCRTDPHLPCGSDSSTRVLCWPSPGHLKLNSGMELREPAHLTWRPEGCVLRSGRHIGIFTPSPNGIQLSVPLSSAHRLAQALHFLQDLCIRASPFEGASA